jgi:flagellar biosynthesis protein FliR
MPVKIALGLIALSISLTYIVPSMNDFFQGLGTRVIRLIGG